MNNYLTVGGCWVMCMAGILLGCNPHDAPNDSHAVNDTQTYHDAHQNEQLQQKVAQLERQLDNSHAKYASRTKDLCPKLVEPRIDSPRIVRNGDKLNKGRCEYYVYLNKGQRITASSANDKVEVHLVKPVFFDFANGTYVAQGYDRHAIQVAYNSFERMPKDFSYSLEIDVE